MLEGKRGWSVEISGGNVSGKREVRRPSTTWTDIVKSDLELRVWH